MPNASLIDNVFIHTFVIHWTDNAFTAITHFIISVNISISVALVFVLSQTIMLCYILLKVSCLCTKFRNILPMLILILLLKGGLNEIVVFYSYVYYLYSYQCLECILTSVQYCVYSYSAHQHIWFYICQRCFCCQSQRVSVVQTYASYQGLLVGGQILYQLYDYRALQYQACALLWIDQKQCPESW